MAELITHRGNGHEFRNEVGGSGTKDATNFAAGLIKGNLKGVHKTSLMKICEPSFGPISEDGEDNGRNYMMPGILFGNTHTNRKEL